MKTNMNDTITSLKALFDDVWKCDDTITVQPHADSPDMAITATISGDFVSEHYRDDVRFMFRFAMCPRTDDIELLVNLTGKNASVRAVATAYSPTENLPSLHLPDFDELMATFLADRHAAKTLLMRMMVRLNRLQIAGDQSAEVEVDTLTV